MKYKTGDQAELGIYECSRCNSAVAIDMKKQILPICPNCNHNSFTKVEEEDVHNKHRKNVEVPESLK
ncbi:zinc ribbon-containing protein [Haloplasma contractile]|uniref:Uncharacterized protein n=1 Tax=Haloplasma contractile SSD-17B TaxID=1033810 RepID=U2E9F9_9MOLU|nr:hypothetical protein [Haloplasma contractile]ERJ11486.1 hypothetical protein HLPCO_002398 [Haloplasma contractile SSD-17B]